MSSPKRRAQRASKPRKSRRKVYTDDPDKQFRFTAERRERFLALVRETVPITRVCTTIGCSEETPRIWQREGRLALAAIERGERLDDRQRDQADFARAFDEAMTHAEVSMLRQIVAGASRDWRAAAWRLACLRPAEYSERYQAKRLLAESEQESRKAALERERAEIDNRMARLRLEIAEAASKGDKESPGFGLAALLTAEDLPAEVRQAVAQWAVNNGLVAVKRLDWNAKVDEADE